MLPICVGRATKIVEYLTEKSKTYDAEITLGFSTTTEDQTGETVETKPVNHDIDKADVEKVLNSLKGKQEQIPPMYSAVKVNGKNYTNTQEQGLK